jgi:hypothetical protein
VETVQGPKYQGKSLHDRDEGWDSVLDVEANIHQAINATIKAYT